MTRIELSEGRRKAIVMSLISFYQEVFDETASEYQADRLLEFFQSELGPSVYNQGVQDARAYMIDKLDDIEGDVFEPIDPVR